MTKTAKLINTLTLVIFFFFASQSARPAHAVNYVCNWVNGKCDLTSAFQCADSISTLRSICGGLSQESCVPELRQCLNGPTECVAGDCQVNDGGVGGCAGTGCPGDPGGGGPGGGGAPAPNPDLPKSVPAGIKGDCPSPDAIDTAIGCIHIGSADDLAADFITWALGLSGGAAFLLIVYAGFQIMTSRGNPKKIELGKDLMWSAIGGLLLIIFSAFFLRVVGVEIFAIFPGGGSA